MQTIPQNNHGFLRGVILLVCAAVVIALTTLPARFGIVQWTTNLFAISGHPNMHDAIGHAALHGMLTLVIYWALRPRLGFTFGFAAAVLSVLTLGLVTEVSQQFSPGRTMMLSDLLANWLGVMTMAALIGFRHSLAHERLQNAA